MKRMTNVLPLLCATLVSLYGLNGCNVKLTETPPAPTPVAVAPNPKAASVNGFPRTVTDARGKQITIAAPPRHIVSLMPSNTEILYAIGMGDNLVMDTTSCDYPPQAKKKPHVDALKPSIEPILAQSPDLIIADEKLNNQLITALDKAGIPILVVGIGNVAQVYDAIRMIGQATGADVNAEQLIKDMQAKIEKTRSAVAATDRKPTVLLMYGDSPIYTTGPDSFISEVIGIAGGANVVSTPVRGDIVSAEKVVELQPEVIIAREDVQKRARLIPGWSEAVPAVQNHRFYTPEDALERPGPRLPQAVDHLAHFLHPELPR